MFRHFSLSTACLVALSAVAGCNSDPEPRPLGADQFYRANDRGGALPPGPTPQPVQENSPTSLDKQHAAEAQRIVAEQIKPATAPTTTPFTDVSTSFATGQFINIGGVIAEVNGNPIYADHVLRTIAPVLAARAKDLDPPKFKVAAAQEIGKQVDEMIGAEVEFAAADRNTNGEDKKTAERMTEAWRSNVITANKGSIETARATFREQGRTFEDAQKEQYRINLVRVYYGKKLFPRVQVTADALRKYYEANRETLFTVRDNASFILIKASAKDIGSDDAAKAKIEDLHARAIRGEEIEKIAEFNQDETLKKTNGQLGPIDRNAYLLDEVDKAVWETEVGKITPIVRVKDDYYFAKVTDKKLGRTMAFEEELVQRKMNEALRSEQLNKMRRDMGMQLRKESVVTKNAAMYDNTLQMAIQNYPRWREQ